MAIFGSATALRLPRPEQALPGRAAAMPVPAAHFVNGHPIAPPFPAGLEQAVFGMGCFWGAERKFWQAPGVYTTAVGYAGGYTPNPTYREVCSGMTGHTEVVLVVFDPKVTSYDAMLKLFWENHDPTQGMRQGNDVGTQYRSAIFTFSPEQQQAAARVARRVPGPAHGLGLRPHHDRGRGSAHVLLRRGLSPAVPGQEPERLLRAGRHGRFLPDRRGRLSSAAPDRVLVAGRRTSPGPIITWMSRVVYTNTPDTPEQEGLRAAHQVRLVSSRRRGHRHQAAANRGLRIHLLAGPRFRAPVRHALLSELRDRTSCRAAT